MSKKYTFELKVNISQTEKKYGLCDDKSSIKETVRDSVKDYVKEPRRETIESQQEDVVIPKKATKISDLETVKRTPDVISFVNESKQLVKCMVSSIDFAKGRPTTQQKKKKGQKVEQPSYKCYWCKNNIPEDVCPIGCPVKYVADRAVKTYHSEISKEKYSISEPITKTKKSQLDKKTDSRINTEKKEYYETDGIFCSFNCCMAFIEDNKRDPVYRSSKTLLLQMYNSIYPEDKIKEIIPAPHWRTLYDFGGKLSLEEFRNAFNKISYTNKGMISCASIGTLFEDKLRF